MTSSADVVVERVLLHGSHGMKASPRTEVGFVAAVTLGGVPDIAAAWSSLLRPYGFSLTMHGVFCHAAPVVDFRGTKGSRLGCELADLLVVVDHTDRSGQTTRRASLIQAKMASKAKRVTLTGKSSKTQLHLYQNWPSFKFRDAVYGANSYSLKCSGTGSGTYGVIDRHFKSSAGRSPQWTQHPAQPTPVAITSEPTFGEFLAHMIGGRSKNYGRIAVPGGADDWSKVVDLLLDITYKKAFRHAATLGPLSPPRGTTALAYLTTVPERQVQGWPSAGLGWRPPFDGFEVIEDESPGGISVLRLEVFQE